MTSVCSTLFFQSDPREIVNRYEAQVEPANGYLTVLDEVCILVDALATETANWSRQHELAALLAGDDGVALSVFIVGSLWALSLCRDGQPGTIAAFTPDESKVLEQLPVRLLTIERQLDEYFPNIVDTEEVDTLFGAMLEGARAAEDGISELLAMLGCPPDWLRWSWYETIPEQLFLDPDLADHVTPLGEAKAFWEE